MLPVSMLAFFEQTRVDFHKHLESVVNHTMDGSDESSHCVSDRKIL